MEMSSSHTISRFYVQVSGEEQMIRKFAYCMTGYMISSHYGTMTMIIHA